MTADQVDGPPQAPPAGPQCSFCGHGLGRVDRLVTGPGVTICNECVDLCTQIIDEELGEQSTRSDWEPPGDDPLALLESLRQTAENLAPLEARIQSTVTQLRGLEVSWARIGDALGISRQAAWQRFSVPEGPDA